MKNPKLLVMSLLLGLLLLAAPARAGEVDRGGDLNVAIGAEPESLDPVETSATPAAMVILHTMEPLFEMTPDGDIVPNLAKGYDVSEDGLEYYIFLEEGIEFHDGTSFNAEAVKFNLNRLQEREAPFAYLIDTVTSIDVVDEYTVKLTLEDSFAPLIAHLSVEFFPMASPTAIEEYGEDFGVNPVGTGPFEFEEWTRGEEVILHRNEDYWGDNAYLDSVTFNIVPEDSTRVVMVETGEADAAMGVPPREMARLEDVEGVDVVQARSLRTIYVGFHAQREPFDDRRVRKAANYAVDNRAIVEQIMVGAGRPSDAPISPDIFGYSAQDRYDYDPELARELLSEAGYEDGFETSLHHPVGRYMMDETIAEAVQSQLAEVGIDAELKTLEWAAYLDFLNKEPELAEHEMYLLGWATLTGDADFGLYGKFHSSQIPPAGSEWSYLNNPAVDVLLREARINPDLAEREQLYARAIEIIWDEAPWLFLHSEVQINAVRKGVKGLVHHPREYVSVKGAYLTKD